MDFFSYFQTSAQGATGTSPSVISDLRTKRAVEFASRLKMIEQQKCYVMQIMQKETLVMTVEVLYFFG